ncbi:CRISPR-associated protein [Crenothrix polyspora]|uniref:CRISPR-associated protein n=1 Tax=Crenothrix polyspora TaxID=360316 RepID=A0A1R4H0Y5_9GAMM|nr:CRISPR-associated ring nuclease Csm6 [Crenothrix polyspora]SJM89894.1 CRISPR-associated protein [Crenothrix polyspora]
MNLPHCYPKRILLAVSGMSPQIVTETLYALAQPETEQAFIPTDIHLISTTTGKNKAMLELLHPQTGKFYQLCKDYGLEGIHFTSDNIHVIPDKNGLLLDDIKTPEENEAAADFITQKVNELTRDTESALHVSIAGGRKTMGYYLGYALSLYGRAQDRLSHVLVTDRYESLKDFFYPTIDSQVIYDRDNQPLDTQAAQVVLASIPFVRLRSGLPHFLLEGTASFNDSIRFARTLKADPLLEIDLAQCCLYANGIAVPLTGINFAFYLWMIEQTVSKPGVIKRSAHANLDYTDSFLKSYQKIFSELKDIEKTENTLEKGMESKWLSERITAVKKAFEKALGTNAARAFIVDSTGKNTQKVHAITLTAQQIKGLELKEACD